MQVEQNVLAFATSLLQIAREAEQKNGWESGDLLRTTLRLLVVAGVDGHGWSTDELTEDVRDLAEAIHIRNIGAFSGAFDCHGMTVTQ